MIILFKRSLKSALKEIQENPKKVVKNQFFTENEWIQFSYIKGQYEYESGIRLGYTPEEVEKTMRDFFEDEALLSQANWKVVERK